MSKVSVFSSVACTIIFTATFIFPQTNDDGISEEQSGKSEITIQDDSESATNDQLPEPMKSDAVSTTTRTVEVEQNIDDSEDREHTATVVNSDLLAAGKARKATGAALTGIGGFFMGGALVYTVLFIADKQTFGIYLGGSTSGYYRTEYYLNPGIFAIPVGAPCLAMGIVNLIKGKNMINDAMGNGDDDDDDDDDDDSSAPFKMVPYVSIQPKVKGYGAGFVATF